MSDVAIPQREMDRGPAGLAVVAEPLLPIEKKLIGWSLGTGLVVLIILGVISRLA